MPDIILIKLKFNTVVIDSQNTESMLSRHVRHYATIMSMSQFCLIILLCRKIILLVSQKMTYLAFSRCENCF